MGFCCSKKKTAAVVTAQDPSSQAINSDASSSSRGPAPTSVTATVPTEINANAQNISKKDVSSIPQQVSPRVVIGRSVSVKVVADDTANPIHTPREATAASPTTTSIAASAPVVADIDSSQNSSSGTANNTATSTSNKPPTSARDSTSSPVVVASPPTSARGRVLSVQKPVVSLAASTEGLDYGAIEMAPLWDAELKTLGEMGFKDLITIMPVLKEHMKVPVSQTPELAGVYNEEKMRTVINVLAIQAAEVSASTQRVILQTNLANSIEHSTPLVE